ncbi:MULTISPECIES: ABC transporter ATP-binding protein [Acidobacteriaceae]|uniref:ABC transporter ATP-binding protein n=1 Tax=Acidobacteriaceae TaxID=204434 RepID=UPI00131E28C9|nr:MULTISPECIES: ABC transporter ATP-binding protein [Acidobacteriaceae]MDW5265168.1 ABC transporter ATP-binding protein [Edaphobacter sp.]
MHPVNNAAKVDGSSALGRNIGVAMRLLGSRQRIELLLITLERIAVGFCDLAVAAAMYLLFLLLQGRGPTHQFWWIPKTAISAALITSILVILRALMDLLSARSVIHQIQKLYTDLLLRLAQGYNEMHWGRFVESNRSELSNHALYTAREAAEFYHRCIELTAAVVIVVAMTAALVYQSPIAACGFAFALSAFYGLHQLFIRSRLQLAAEKREASLRMLQRNLADIFSSGKEIRTYRNLGFFHERIRRQAEHVAASNVRIKFLPQIASSVADQGAVLLFLCIIVAVQLRHGDARQMLSLLAFYFVLSRRMVPLISQISVIAGHMESSYENVKIVAAELKECRRYRVGALPVLLPDSGFAIQLKEVSFSFREGTPILRNASLLLREGETVVLHGPSGSGKSSLLNLIAGVSQPTEGVIQVDRTSIAYVPQEIVLLDDSIRNNLLFGLPDKSDEELMRALSTAQLAEFVAAQSFGLETSVGDNGALFSGGQRQRLGVARAILRGARLLLLDEATSALDEENERQILENLSASRKTVLLVTHRVLTQVFGHRVFQLQGGCLVEEFPRMILGDEQGITSGIEC